MSQIVERYLAREHENVCKETQTQVIIKIEDVDDDIKNLNEREIIIICKGNLEDICRYFTKLLENLHKEFPELDSSILKLLIPNNYVMKLIGSKGSKIKEIAARASAAQIKILSERKDEMNLQDCVVTINGSLNNKQEAARIILYELEKFKSMDKFNQDSFVKRTTYHH